MSLKELLSNRVRVGLKSVKYDYLGDLAEESEIDYYDEVNVGKITRDYLEIVVTRKVFFKPEDVFNMEVSYYVLHLFKDGLDIEENLKNIDVVQEVLSDVEYYSQDEQAKVSLLIANITNSFTLNPLITAPIFMEQDN